MSNWGNKVKSLVAPQFHSMTMTTIQHEAIEKIVRTIFDNIDVFEYESHEHNVLSDALIEIENLIIED